MRRILWWLRRDLRLNDNLVLHQALLDGAAVLPVFVLDPKLMDSPKLAPARKQFLFDSLAELDANLKRRGSYLIVQRGEPSRKLLQLVRETQADAVYFHADYTPYARARDARVTAALERAGVRVRTFNDLYLADPAQVVKPDGSPYTVYARYRARFQPLVTIPPRYALRRSLNTPPGIRSQMPAFLREPHFARGGERAARALLKDFVARENGLAQYAEMRNALAADATSHLSPHLHLGTISVREVVRAAHDAFPRGKAHAAHAADVWLDELIWREFFNQVLYHFPHAARRSFRPAYANLKWRTDDAAFAAWREGCTGYPLVDAAMRQLRETGWMHNRARMVAASFLTKDLLIDWRQGEAHFLQHLIDGDMASNNGGWQWTAGTGTDAQPYFRIFNPVLQSRRYDPRGEYIRRYVPELANLPARYVHAPWEMPGDVARTAQFTLGADYPFPIVNHAAQRERARQLYQRVSRK
jgi:deoxyribodipyrimidine photo-lyase